ncbi:MAG: hypothetical protein JSS89_13800 [Bacteroidetes bacterium]|nr:hypothetical protein [Bacteroidota bacterium]
MEQNVIRLNKARSFTDMLSAVFEILRQIALPLLRILLVIAGPFVVLGALLVGIGSVNVFGALKATTLEPSLFLDAILSAFLQNIVYWVIGIPVIMISFIVILVVSQCYVITYQQLGRIPTDAEAREGRAGAWRTAARLFSLLYLAYVLCMAVIALPAFASPFLLIASIPIGTTMLLWAMVPMWISFAACRADGLSAIQGIRYAWELVKGNWWFCFGAFFVVSIVQGLIGSVTNVLQYVAMIALMAAGVDDSASSTAGSYVIAGTYGLNLFVSAFLAAMVHVAAVVTYYDLVERKEARSMSGMIDQLGQQ